MTLATMVSLVGTLVAVMRPTLARAAFGDINAFAGTNSGAGYTGDGGPATSATLNQPAGMAEDAAGNVYIAEQGNNVVRKVSPSGVISTFAGTGAAGYSGDGGPGASAQFNTPYFLAFDAAGNLLITDFSNNVVRSVNSAGTITTVAGTGAAGYSGDGGLATSALLNGPRGIVALAGGGFLVADSGNNVLRKVSASGTITTFAGNGTSGYAGDGGAATSAEFNIPIGLAMDAAGNVYIGDFLNNVVRRVSTSGIITTFAGTGAGGFSGDGGPATSAQLNGAVGVTAGGGSVFVTDYFNNRVRKIDPSGTITTVAGSSACCGSGDGGPATAAGLFQAQGLLPDRSGNLLVGDTGDNRVRIVTGIVFNLLQLQMSAPANVGPGQTFAYSLAVVNNGSVGNATGVTLSDTLPAGLTLVSATASQGTCTPSGSTVNCALGGVAGGTSATATITVTAPSTSVSLTNTATVSANETDPAPSDNTTSTTTLVDAADVSVTATASPNPATPGAPLTYTVTAQNAGPYAATGVAVSDTLPSAGATFQSTSSSQGSCGQSGGVVTCSLGTIASGGTATITVGVVVAPSPFVSVLSDVASVSATNVDPNPGNNTATLQTAVSGAFRTITTFAGASQFADDGDGGPATAADLNQPTGVAEDSAGNVYIADFQGNTIRKVNPSGIITTIAGTGRRGYAGDGGAATAAQLNQPLVLSVDSSGNLLIAEYGNNVIRKVSTAGTITTVAGTGVAGYSGDGGAATVAHLSGPTAVLALPGGGFLISDNNNNVVRKVDASGTITTIAGNGTAGSTGDGGAATAGELNSPEGLVVDPSGNLFIAECGNDVRKVDLSGTITTYAGNSTGGFSGDGGPATAAQLSCAVGLAYSAGTLFVGDYNNNRIRKIDATGTITTVVGDGSSGSGSAGDGGPALLASLAHPFQIMIDPAANLFIADNLIARVREVSTIAPDLLHLSQSAPQTVGSGSSYSISLTAANPGTVGTATGVTLSDALPAGLALTGASSAQGTCNVTGSTVTCAIGQLAPFSLATVTLNVTASTSSVALTNTARVTANEADPAPGDNTATATTYVDAADLSVTGTGSPNVVVAGQVLSETWSVKNAGPFNATGVQFAEPLQTGVTIQSASASQGTCTASGQKVTCQLGPLAAGGSATVSIGLVPSRNVVGMSDTATVSGNQVDQNPANNTATVQTTVVLGVATQFTDPNNTPIDPGQEVFYPAAITAGADGNMWYGRLFPNFGEYQSQIGRVSTKGVYQPAYTADQSFVQGMVLGSDGNVWFDETGFSGDPGGNSIGRITPQGQVTLFPTGGSTFQTNGSLTLGPDGNVWAMLFGRVVRLTPKGAMTSFSVGGGPTDITAGPDGALWFNPTVNSGPGLGRITTTGQVTTFPTPTLCNTAAPVTGPDHLLWVTDNVCDQIAAFAISNGQLTLVAQFSTAGQPDFGVRGPDAVYFSLSVAGAVGIVRATTAGPLYYSTGNAGGVQDLAAGPDGNIWFTDATNPGQFPTVQGIGHISPPPSGTASGAVIGQPHLKAGKATTAPTPTAPTGSDPRHHKPPPIAGNQCADVINPAQGTVINGDVLVSDNGFGCVLSQVTINGNLHVTAGAFADLSFSKVNGSVIVDTGGQVHIVGSHVSGSVTGNGGSFITVFSSKVGVDLTSNPSQYGVAMVCGTTVAGNLTDSGATDTTFPSVIGDPTGPIPCAANSIGGNLTLWGNSEQILVHGNNVAGAIVVTNNPSTSPFDIRNNNASSLSCSGNAVAPTGGGNHGTKSGQCAKL